MPSLREFYGGLAVITVLGAVMLMRGGHPQPGMAAATTAHPLPSMGPSTGDSESIVPSSDLEMRSSDAREQRAR